MIRKLLVLSASCAGLWAMPAHASAVAAPADPAPVAADAPLRLAQSGDVQVYYDGMGRRVLVDRWSGEIIAIQRPRNTESRRQIREMLRERERRPDRYYLDDPDDMARLERRKQEEAQGGRRVREPEIFIEPSEDEDDYVRPRARREREPVEQRRVVRRDRTGERVPLPEFLEREPEPDYETPSPDMAGRNAEPEYIEPLPEEEPSFVTPPIVERAPLPETAEPDEGQQLASRDPDALTGEPGETIVEQVKPAIEPATPFGARDDVAALQVLLDRAGASPGVIDGKFGSNVDKALAAYTGVTGKVLRSTDTAGIRQALDETGGAPFVDYTITPEDAAGPFVASVPVDYGQKAKLERLSFTSVTEKLAERFHMDEAYLKALNPEAVFGRPGTIIRVANVGQDRQGEVARIVADKARKQVRAYGADGKLLAAYPATIGSSDTPSPTGLHAISRIAFDPEYTYNPKLNFKQGDNDKVLTIPPGPNGPVGSIWIALDKPTYGIHGTPEPSKIGKAESHGCVRLTNWDAAELARMVKPGVQVDFVE